MMGGDHIKKELEEKGYCVIENVLNEEEVQTALQSFHDWYKTNDQAPKLHNKISPHGIIKHLEIGHQHHAWYVRTRPKVQNVFKDIWNTDDLVVSYDGTCYIPADVKKKDNVWTHTDQAPTKESLCCYQGFVALTDNIERTLVVYEGSHKLHQAYAKEKNLLCHNKDWLLIEQEYLRRIHDRKRVVSAKAGSLVLWDSRTFHQNQYGTLPEERVVQYVCYLPKSKRSQKMQEKRMKYFQERRTTSHWPYPVKVNGLQPQTYGNKELAIDYNVLVHPKIEDLLPEIKRLI
jgi:ectoine hydroxylase-related dioxygenase (phytanoyl-CoA dioxygenase family)